MNLIEQITLIALYSKRRKYMFGLKYFAADLLGANLVIGNDEELYMYYIVKLARKFRLAAPLGKMNDFIIKLRGFVWSDRGSEMNSIDTLLRDKFEELFSSFDSGEIREYRLPKPKFLVSENYAKSLKQEACEGENNDTSN